MNSFVVFEDFSKNLVSIRREEIIKLVSFNTPKKDSPSGYLLTRQLQRHYLTRHEWLEVTTQLERENSNAK